MPRKSPTSNETASCSIARFQRVAPHLRNFPELPVATVETILNVLSIAASHGLKTMAVVAIATRLKRVSSKACNNAFEPPGSCYSLGDGAE